MKISVITPSFNQGRFIEETILSVVRQGYSAVEHIVIDGGSTDQTIEILRRYPHVIWVSEKDNGQADALNKGLARATGDIIAWINSDDTYMDGVFTEVVEYFRQEGTQWVVGNVTSFYEVTGDLVPRTSPPITLPRLLDSPDIVKQPPTFYRRSALEFAGGWNQRYQMAMDYDLWVRLARISSPVMVDRQWARFRIHAEQKTSGRNLLRQRSELVEIMRREGGSRGQIWSFQAGRWAIYFKVLIKHLLLSIGLLGNRYESRPLRIRAPRTK